jgi:hypothetical protein
MNNVAEDKIPVGKVQPKSNVEGLLSKRPTDRTGHGALLLRKSTKCAFSSSNNTEQRGHFACSTPVRRIGQVDITPPSRAMPSKLSTTNSAYRIAAVNRKKQPKTARIT